VLSAGQSSDVKMALELVQGLKAEEVIADRAYDADYLLHYLDSEGIKAVIPPRSSRLMQRTIDYKAYKKRIVIERTVNKLKQYLKIATRYEKTAASFSSLCFLAAIFINLKL
jgi:transposase